MTSASIFPNSRPKSGILNRIIGIVIATEITADIIRSCPAERDALSLFLLPMYWLIITAPPDDSAVNRNISTVLNDVTSETPETSASLEKLTTKVSAIPTNISKNCSINSGTIKFRRSLLVNIFYLDSVKKFR